MGKSKRIYQSSMRLQRVIGIGAVVPVPTVRPFTDGSFELFSKNTVGTGQGWDYWEVIA